MNDNRNRRRHYFIDHDFQTKFILKFCLVTIASAMLIGICVYYFTMSSTTVAIENTRVVVKSTGEYILPAISLTIILVAIFSALCVLILTLFVSHKIVGPAYRIKADLEAMRAGKLNMKFKIRENDQLRELAEGFEGLAVILKEKMTGIKDQVRQLEGYLSSKNYQVSSKDAETIKEMIEKINQDINFFDLP